MVMSNASSRGTWKPSCNLDQRKECGTVKAKPYILFKTPGRFLRISCAASTYGFAARICFVCHSSAEEASECSTQELCMRAQPHFHLLAQCLMVNLTCSRLTVRSFSFYLLFFFQLAHIPRYRLRTVTARECG